MPPGRSFMGREDTHSPPSEQHQYGSQPSRNLGKFLGLDKPNPVVQDHSRSPAAEGFGRGTIRQGPRERLLIVADVPRDIRPLEMSVSGPGGFFDSTTTSWDDVNFIYGAFTSWTPSRTGWYTIRVWNPNSNSHPYHYLIGFGRAEK
jgi:hypothetical protein